jgi:hypothetical protein
MRDRYPDARPDALARLAAAECVRTARRRGALTSAAGLLGSAATTGVLARAHAHVVLTIAAAYGIDPTQPERADDLLELLRVPRLTLPTIPALAGAGRILAGFAVRRAAARLVPFGAALAGAIQFRRHGHVAQRARPPRPRRRHRESEVDRRSV